jgi:hypothetical protein
MKMQKKLSMMLEQYRFETRIEVAQKTNTQRPRDLARLHAITAKHTALWLYSSCLGANLRLWLAPANFRIAMYQRLGLPLVAQSSRCAHVNCSKVSDIYGDHSIACLCEGNKTRIHTAVLDQVMELAGAAHAQPHSLTHSHLLARPSKPTSAYCRPLRDDEFTPVRTVSAS